jgi:hypothetical protein
MRVAVVGGGIQGTGVAIELALRGVSVDLFEKREDCLTQASSQNEGKLHLGFVYGKDSTLATARLLAEGALRFRPILRRWLETEPLDCPLSSPFHYFVHRKSLVSADELSGFYNAVSSIVRGLDSKSSKVYFGIDAGAPVVRLSRGEMDCIAEGRCIDAVFRTPEIAIDPESIAGLLRTRLYGDVRIRVHCCAEVTAVLPGIDTTVVTVRGSDGFRRGLYDHVVNASWEDLLTIDATANMAPVGPSSFRLKRYLRVRAADTLTNIPSATIVLGAFGDVVTYGNGELYLSWYPAGCQGMSSEFRRPTWPLVLGAQASSSLRDEIYEELCRIVPSLRYLPRKLIEDSDVRGGIILARGTTDIDDPSSELHQRYQVGVRSLGRYHSIHTGKFTLAPLFAQRTADRILGNV